LALHKLYNLGERGRDQGHATYYYRAAWNAEAVYSDENSVCPSVKHVDCDKTEERSVQIFIPYERSFIPDQSRCWIRVMLKLT